MANKNENSAKKWKVMEVKFELNLNRVIEETGGCGNANSATIWETLDMQPEELNKSKLANINEERDCIKKGEDVPEEVTLAKNFALK